MQFRIRTLNINSKSDIFQDKTARFALHCVGIIFSPFCSLTYNIIKKNNVLKSFFNFTVIKCIEIKFITRIKEHANWYENVP